jgi:hypothetical protein
MPPKSMSDKWLCSMAFVARYPHVLRSAHTRRDARHKRTRYGFSLKDWMRVRRALSVRTSGTRLGGRDRLRRNSSPRVFESG